MHRRLSKWEKTELLVSLHPVPLLGMEGGREAGMGSLQLVYNLTRLLYLLLKIYSFVGNIKMNQLLQLCTPRTTWSDSVIWFASV